MWHFRELVYWKHISLNLNFAWPARAMISYCWKRLIYEEIKRLKLKKFKVKKYIYKKMNKRYIYIYIYEPFFLHYKKRLCQIYLLVLLFILIWKKKQKKNSGPHLYSSDCAADRNVSRWFKRLAKHSGWVSSLEPWRGPWKIWIPAFEKCLARLP